MKLSRLVLVALCALPLLSCSNGGECDKCDSDDDCTGERVCRNFVDDNGNVVDKRCASGAGVTTCRTFR